LAADLSTLSAEDRADFESRLRVYGLDGSAVQEPLSVQSRSTLTLTAGQGQASARPPIVRQVFDFDVLSTMIGVDDRLFETVPQRSAMPDRMALDLRGVTVVAAPGLRPHTDDMATRIGRDFDLEGLDSGELDNVRLAARAYLRGNSKALSSFKPIIERAIGRVDLPVWPVLNVTVADGSTLEFGPGVNVLAAHEVTIEGSGRIVSRGHLTVNATILRRTRQPFFTGGIHEPVFHGTIFG